MVKARQGENIRGISNRVDPANYHTLNMNSKVNLSKVLNELILKLSRATIGV